MSLERILDRTRDIRLSEEHHGPPDARRFSYAPTWVLRGLNHLHIEFTPVEVSAMSRSQSSPAALRASDSGRRANSQPTVTAWRCST